MRLVECVPNVSEGRDRKILDAIASVITTVPGVRLLDMDPGAATNRTVFTFVGSPDAAAEAAFLVIRRAAELIDMRAHKGAHPRMGATDVCPFVPLGDTTMAECVELAHRLGRRVGDELGIPVYYYEEAATLPARRSLAEIRRGEYEGLPQKMIDPAWHPDAGPARLNERSGATVIGAREFLIAYNVNLNTGDRRLANTIAQNIRETGRPRRGADGKILKDPDGRVLTEAGPSMLAHTRATGWYIEEYGQAQVSINLTNFKITPPHMVFEAVTKEATALGLRVTGSEVVGLVPLEAMRMAGRHYLGRQGKSPALPESDLVRTAIVSLGLEDVAPFDPARKIVEYSVMAPGPLVSMTVSRFASAVSAATPAPGGGSVAALAGALGAGLCAMVASISYEKKGFEDRHDRLTRLGLEAHELSSRMLDAVDEDATAFDQVLAAGRMPKGTEEDRRARDIALQQATRAAIEVPLSVMRGALRALTLAGEAAEHGAPATLSDAGVAALASAAAIEGAWYNVRINLPGLTDDALARRLRQEADTIASQAENERRAVGARVRAGLGLS